MVGYLRLPQACLLYTSIGDAVQNTGAGQDNADGSGRDAVADAGGITRHADEGIDAHTDKMCIRDRLCPAPSIHFKGILLFWCHALLYLIHEPAWS